MSSGYFVFIYMHNWLFFLISFFILRHYQHKFDLHWSFLCAIQKYKYHFFKWMGSLTKHNGEHIHVTYFKFPITCLSPCRLIGQILINVLKLNLMGPSWRFFRRYSYHSVSKSSLLTAHNFVWYLLKYSYKPKLPYFYNVIQYNISCTKRLPITVCVYNMVNYRQLRANKCSDYIYLLRKFYVLRFGHNRQKSWLSIAFNMFILWVHQA